MEIMLAVNGIYDGKNIRLTEKVTEKRKYRVVVTFIEELEQADKYVTCTICFKS